MGDNAGQSGEPAFAARALDWFWRGKALAVLRSTLPQLGLRALAFSKRAKESHALAQVAWTTADLGGQATACELYRQSAYWSLRALSPDSPVAQVPGEYSESVWAGLDDALLTPLAPSAEQREQLRARLVGESFVRFAELPPSEQASVCLQLRALSTTLLQCIQQARRGYDRVRRQRAWRVALLPLIVVLALVPAFLRRQRHVDLAEGTTWQLSSSFIGGGGCTPPQQNCTPAEHGWFFHTEMNDRDPWIEFELDGVKDVSTVEIENRTDCCAERAVPLAVEVSLDHNSWQQVAERRKPFETWRANFPSVQASWVRLHLLHTGPLHLRRVRIFK